MSSRARSLFSDSDNSIYLSVVSGWEIAVKFRLGQLSLPQPPDRWVPEQRQRRGIQLLTLQEEAALHAARLPPLHRDPFDRMLVCQALVHGLVLLTPDPSISQYPVRVAW